MINGCLCATLCPALIITSLTVALTVVALFVFGGEPLFQCIAFDVTARKQAEVKLDELRSDTPLLRKPFSLVELTRVVQDTLAGADALSVKGPRSTPERPSQ